MRGKNFDVFISYRRSDGDAIARILNAEFALRDFRCFLDFDSLGGGKFDEKIEAAILDAPVFAMVLTPDYFSRCNDKGDWVRREIELALANNKIIVPINYDRNLNGIPDYLEEDFKARIGCHNFATVHKDDTFKSSFNQMVEQRILKVFGKIVKQEHKAKVSVIADADCELIVDDEVIATVQKDKTNFILLEKGEHLIIVRSSEFPQIKDKIEKTINDLSFKYLINIKLEDKIKIKRDEEIARQQEEIQRRKEEEDKRQREADRLERERQEIERIRREEKARLEQERIKAERRRKEEEARLGYEKFEAERRRREEESMSPIEKVVRQFVETPPSLKQNLTEHSDGVCSVCWSPDGKYLVSGSRKIIKGKYFWNTDTYYGEVIIWDANSGQILKTMKGHTDYAWSVCWSPDGKYLASGSWDKTVKIWDVNSGMCIRTLKGHYFDVYSVCWSPDGKYLASGSRDANIIIWDANSGKELQTLEGHSDSVFSVSWSPDGKYLASGSADRTIKIWDANSGERLQTLKGHLAYVNSVCWSPDGKCLASSSYDKTVNIWYANTGGCIRTLKEHFGGMVSVCWSPDGKYLASGSGDWYRVTHNNTVKIWDAKSGVCLRTLEGHSDSVYSVSWSPDGKYLASGSKDKTVKIWGVE